MKKILLPLVLLILGLAVGGGAAFATAKLLGPASPKAAEAAPDPVDAEPHLVPAGKLLAPLVFKDGRLSGYVRIDFTVDVASAEKVEFATTRLPMLLHEINMKTWKTPMASGPDGMLADLDTFRNIAEAAATKAYGKGVVRRVIITEAVPA